MRDRFADGKIEMEKTTNMKRHLLTSLALACASPHFLSAGGQRIKMTMDVPEVLKVQ